MKKIIKLLSVILSLIILISSFTIVSQAEGINYKNYKGYVYTKVAGIEIKNYTGKKKSITVPKKIEKKEVKEVILGKKTKVTSAVLPEYATYIRVSQAPNLKKISIDKNNSKFKVKNNLLLNKKGDKLRSAPGGLKTVKLPKCVTIIYHQGFAGAKVEKVVLGANFEKFDTYAFYKCKKLKTIVVNSETKTPRISKQAFEDVTNTVNFYVKNKKIAKTLRKRLNSNGPEKFKVYVGSKLYK